MFDLTGRTGSYFYMAPEVLHNEPYNEKARHRVTQLLALVIWAWMGEGFNQAMNMMQELRKLSSV